MATRLARLGFGRTGVEARSQGNWSGVHQPLLPVDEFAHRVEVSGMAGGLSDHVEQDIPAIVQAPLTPGEGPPGQVGIGRRGGDDGIRQGRLMVVAVKDIAGW